MKNPELKGLPVIVGNPNARESGRGVVLTCSYETRKFGVRSGMAMKIALDKCPDAVIVKSSYRDYSDISNRIMKLLQELNVPMRKTSIDEAYLDISTLAKDYDEASQLAKNMQGKVYDQENLTVSIGVGPTLKIAKIGSDYNKPNGITIIKPEKLKEFFNGLELIKIPGIGIKTSERLKEKGYTTCDQLYEKSEYDLVEIFGSWGTYLYDVFRGKTTNKILPQGVRKSISNESTFVGKPGDIDKYLEITKALFNKTFSGLVKGKFLTKTVGLKIRFNGFYTITRAKSIPAPTQKKELLWDITQEIIEPYLYDERGLRLIGVGFYNLELSEENQSSLDDFNNNTLQKDDRIVKIKELDPKKTLDDYF